MGALRCTCKGGTPFCAAHPASQTEPTDVVVSRILDEARAAHLDAQVVYIEETAVITVQNMARLTPRGPDMVPGFYVVKIHKGHVVSEHFI